MPKFATFVKKKRNLKINMLRIKSAVKLGTMSLYRTIQRCTHSTCNLKYSVPKEIPIVLQNRSNNEYHFIIKEVAEEFEKQFTYLGQNTKKQITFSFSIEEEVIRIDKNGKEMTYHILQITIY